ncbi:MULTISPECIES: antibiotic biosynthesis monooxygenase family protein [Streptomyces]|uniref:Antibiotic biosynthesis monooxygenase n=1 Tax=Streptomyces cyaneofuscatus TaxID=66883 RepID=A0ABZ1F0N4_9ACTN|nr:antibiotic biosynthesis monooxygenase family protein [Streptomyces cyaneofuscatus]WSB09985.1 antibiotic biosynthesis monooxygenase [Streptomyces cyaneofuscatus]WSD46482.1 antibiotic biosynthesis monooxygenase [Streptomyces cyaneofuscatus]WTA89858.1 antibiotic biosynthesis monooxygenase [Streptomyces cyaneofuscatus]
MPLISPDDGYLSLFNLFDTEDRDKESQVLKAMRGIVDNADYPGWISSTVHAGQDTPGTANLVQWRSAEDLAKRYAGEEFRTRTVPEFHRLATTVQLIRTEAVFAQRHPSLGDTTEISPERDDYTVIFVLSCEPENQAALVDTLAKPDEWLLTVPGYRSHAYFRSLDGTSVLNYAQWDGKEAYDAFHTLPDTERPLDVQKGRVRARSLSTGRWANTFRAWHSRSAQS